MSFSDNVQILNESVNEYLKNGTGSYQTEPRRILCNFTENNYAMKVIVADSRRRFTLTSF